MKKQKNQFRMFLAIVSVILATSSFITAQPLTAKQQAQQILKACNVKGGLIVHIGCGDGLPPAALIRPKAGTIQSRASLWPAFGGLTAALRVNDGYLVHGLDRSEGRVVRARQYIQSLGVYGAVSVERLEDDSLPYVDNLVNLVVSEGLGTVPMSEVMRVLCPNGVAYIRNDGKWVKTVKPRPEEIDDWTHYLYDASNNAVSHDTVVGPPRRMQWVGSPRYARHHDRMSSVSAVVSAGGRIFYIFDEGSRVSILLGPKWSLIARDAFNGTILWKRQMGKWHTHLWPLKSGPAQLPRRLAATGDRVYVTLSLDAPLTALDAATGKTVRTYTGTKATEEVILSDGVLFLLVNKDAEEPQFASLKSISNASRGKFWDEAPRQIMALSADATLQSSSLRSTSSGQVLWAIERRVLPVTLAADRQRVFFHDGRSVVCLNRSTGKELWRSEPVARTEIIRSFYAPTLVVYEDVVLFSGGETAGKQSGWYTSGHDTMTALSAKTGKVLWTAYHPPSGYRSPEDLLVANGLVWTGETLSGRAVGVFTGRDPHTGQVKAEFPPNIETYWFHHRCHRGKATDNYLLTSRAGIEFIDVRNEQWIPHHWVRGACLYGVMPANGLIYAPQHPCACYLESKLYGFNALAPASTGRRVPRSAANDTHLEEGPAYGKDIAAKAAEDEWPTYRHDIARSGAASTAVPAALKRAWQADIGARLTSPVIAEGKVFVASVDTHTIHALDAASGKRLWHYTAGGRVDSPPTIYQGRVLFGSADGWVYCLAASDGTLAWRFRAAPMDQRLMSFEQVESVWPVHGSVLVQDDVLYCVAGRSMFLDGGLRLWRLDPKTGRALSKTVLDDRDRATGKDLQAYVSWLNMPPALPDILSSDGRLVYMRSQPFNLDGTRPPLKKMPRASDADRGAPPATQRPEHAHLFSPTGFLDDSGWHRTYWMYGSTFVSGWCGYYLAGKAAPAGRILVFDDSRVYGFGRKPQYYRWTTPIEHHLFAADKAPSASSGASTGRSLIRVEKSKSLNPAGKPVTVEAWVKAEQPSGAVLARGGGVHGYALYLQGGRPQFAVRINNKLCSVTAREGVVGRWAHVAGILTAGKELRLYVDGKLVASAKAPGLIAEDPQEAMEIGTDEDSKVGDYDDPFAFKGLIDEVRVYHRALSGAEIKKRASATLRSSSLRSTRARKQGTMEKAGLVLWYSFDKGDAGDASGHKNKGKVEGAVPVKGKVGRAMRFTGKAGPVPQFLVRHYWTKDVPLFVRAMVLAGGTLFVAGPPDVIDEQQVFRQIDDPKVRQSLADQDAALDGKKGALLLAVSAADGKKLAQYNIDSPPVFDGMAGAAGRLYMATVNGELLCFCEDK